MANTETASIATTGEPIECPACRHRFLRSHPSPGREDLKRASARIKPKLKLLFEQPPDVGILNSISRKENRLKKLADKPVTSLSGKEAFLLITGRNLAYANAPDLFHLWWRSVDKDSQKEINIAAEDFEDVPDYVWKSMKRSLRRTTVPPGLANFH